MDEWQERNSMSGWKQGRVTSNRKCLSMTELEYTHGALLVCHLIFLRCMHGVHRDSPGIR